MTAVGLLVLVILANGSPVIAARLFRSRWSAPVDGGRLWSDGRPLLGPSKTWRGIVAAVLVCVLAAPLVGFSPVFAGLFASLAMLGDLCSSFIKRRMGLVSSARASGLDQVPESLVPVVFAAFWLDLAIWQAIVVVFLFVAINILLSPILYRLGVRKRPH